MDYLYVDDAGWKQLQNGWTTLVWGHCLLWCPSNLVPPWERPFHLLWGPISCSFLFSCLQGLFHPLSTDCCQVANLDVSRSQVRQATSTPGMVKSNLGSVPFSRGFVDGFLCFVTRCYKKTWTSVLGFWMNIALDPEKNMEKVEFLFSPSTYMGNVYLYNPQKWRCVWVPMVGGRIISGPNALIFIKSFLWWNCVAGAAWNPLAGRVATLKKKKCLSQRLGSTWERTL